jgi:hypothetical protein
VACDLLSSAVTRHHQLSVSVCSVSCTYSVVNCMQQQHSDTAYKQKFAVNITCCATILVATTRYVYRHLSLAHDYTAVYKYNSSQVLRLKLSIIISSSISVKAMYFKVCTQSHMTHLSIKGVANSYLPLPSNDAVQFEEVLARSELFQM